MNDNQHASDLTSGKGYRDENFPVASFLLHARYRPVIFAFYRFARAADDIADHPTAPAEEKLRQLEQFRAGLMGENDNVNLAVDLRKKLKTQNITAQHAADLLEAFRRDVTTTRYADWNALMGYCRFSAMPVGRFVLDVHGESRDLWPANDALCAALQVINHLQDCAKDYHDLGRVYIPLDDLKAQNADIALLGAEKSSAALRCTLDKLVERTAQLLEAAHIFASQIADARLALEVTVIQKLAEDLCHRLRRYDPLCERVHHRKRDIVPILLQSAGHFASIRYSRKTSIFPAANSSP